MKNRFKIIIIFAAVLIIAAVVIAAVLSRPKPYTPPQVNLSSIKATLISDIDGVYKSEAIGKFADIRNLPAAYTPEQAAADGCFVNIAGEFKNTDAYDGFMKKCGNMQTAFLRVVKTAEAGGTVICDLLYDEKQNVVFAVTDTTRDSLAAEGDAIINMKKYENIAEYEINGSTYLTVFSGPLTAEFFGTDSAVPIICLR